MAEPHVSRSWRRSARRTALAAAVGLALAAAGASADPAKTLRVGTSGDYAPFSLATRGELGPYDGFDAALARRYAADRGLEIEWIRFRWQTLLKDLEADRFDVAMAGITMRPERSLAGRFSVPVAETGAVALVRDSERVTDIDLLNREHMRIAVNRGGHLEALAHQRFPKATLVAVGDNAAVPRALADESVDAVVTDTVEAVVWEKKLANTRRLGPFSQDRKAMLFAPGAAERAADLDAWLLEREADGTLAELRTEYLGAGSWTRAAEPLPALVAALDERLALMPWVGAVKREAGLPIEDASRESVVLDEGVAAVLDAAKARRQPPPSGLLVRRFFRVQLEAAKQVQLDALRDDDFVAPSPLPDLEDALRPAISRIGVRIAQLLMAQPAGQTREQVAEAIESGLRSPWLSEASRRAIVDALAALMPAAPPVPEAD